MNVKTPYFPKVIPAFLSSLLLLPNIAIANTQTNLLKCHDHPQNSIEYCQDSSLSESQSSSHIMESLPVIVLLALGAFLIYLLYNLVMIMIVMLKLLIWQIQAIIHGVSKK